jgi:transposase
MVRIIKRGPPKKKVYEFTCNNCKSVLQADENEVKFNYGDQRDPYVYYSITCPVCGYTTGTYKDPSKIVDINE